MPREVQMKGCAGGDIGVHPGCAAFSVQSRPSVMKHHNEYWAGRSLSLLLCPEKM